MIDKMSLLKEICDRYNFEIYQNEEIGIVCYQNEECSVAAKTVEELLIELLPTLEHNNWDCDLNNERHVWSDDEIEFIMSLKY
ncbi:MAG: hypothetical protein RSF40_01505 [Oscillospiraceae bacterium]